MTDVGVWVHILGGTVALVSMVGPMVTVKGGRAHRLWGRAYVAGMAVVVLSAWALSAVRIAGGDAGSGPWFLSMVGLLAGASTWSGWRVRAEKGRTEPHRDPLDRGVMGLLTAVGLASVGRGAMYGDVLFLAFGSLCVFLGSQELRAMAAVPTSKWDWWYRHMGSMLAACIGTTTAFLVVNTNNLPPLQALPAWFVWLLPTFIGVPGLLVWTARWKQHLEPEG
jgi:uncharacterized membrane protein